MHQQMQSVRPYLADENNDGSIHVMEMFGGASGVTKCAIRRKLRTGKVFDVVFGVDLTDPVQQDILRTYVRRYKTTCSGSRTSLYSVCNVEQD